MPPFCSVDTSIWFDLGVPFAIQGLSALFGTALTLLFLYKFTFQLSKEERFQPLRQICGLVIFLVALERTLRIYGTYLLFYGSETSGIISFNLINLLVPVFALLTLFFRTLQLRYTFKHSNHALSDRQMDFLYALIIGSVLSMLGWAVMFGLLAIMDRPWVSIVAGVWALLAVILVLLNLHLVSYEFVKRLKILVTNQHSTKSAVKKTVSTPTGTANSNPLSRNATEISTSFPAPTASPRRVSRSVSLARARSVSVDPNQRLMEAAAVHSVLSFWLTLASILVFTSVVFYAYGRCTDTFAILGHALFGVGGSMISLCVYLSLNQAKQEYELCCLICDDLALHIDCAFTNE